VTEAQPADRTRPHGAGPAARRVVAETVLISVALGLAVGLVWWLVAPEVSVGVRSGQSVLIAAEARNLFGVDVSFAAVGAVAGLLLGTAMFARHREHPTAVLVGLVLGGVVGSLVAWQVGSALGPGPLGERTDGAADGVTLPIPLDLEATGVLLFWPITAVVAMLVLGALTPALQPPHRSPGDAISPGDRSEPSSHR
jgi:hypothetical protein